MKLCSLASVFAAMLLVAGAASAADGKYVSQQGTWKLNATETSIPSRGFKPPIDELLEVTKDDGTVLEYTVQTVTPAGLVPGAHFLGAYDGKLYDSGSGPATVSYEHISHDSYKDIVLVGEGVTITEIGTFSHEGKRMHLNGKYEDKANNFSYEYLLVYDKVK